MPFNTTYINATLAEAVKNDISYIAICTDYDNPNREADISTALENGRIEPSVSRSNNIITITATIPTSRANVNSSLITNTPSSKLTFDVVDGTLFNIGDRVEIFSSAGLIAEQRKIANISTNTITLDRELTNLPVNNETLKQMNSVIHLINGGTLTANSGTSIYAFQYIFFKNSSIEKDFTFTIDVSGL